MRHISGNASHSWLSDLLPDNLHGRVIPARNWILIIVAMVAVFLFSQLRELFKEQYKQIFFLIPIVFTVW